MAVNSIDRTTGHFRCSIGTSLALEAISHTGEFADNKGELPIKTIECLWFNLRTLVRNAMQAFTSEQFLYLTTDAVIESVEEDIETIKQFMADYAPSANLEFYFCTYKGLDKTLKLAKFRQSNTAIQQLAESIQRGCADHFTAKEGLLKQFAWKLEGKLKTTILTHYPLDLVSYYRFPDLQLLESHTGAIKSRKDWPSKMNLGKDIVCIPFNIATLQIFGDSAMFSPQDLKIRRLLIKIGEKRKWNALTSYNLMLTHVKLEYEPFLLEFMTRY